MVASVITIAVSTNACGNGSATVPVLVPSVIGSTRQPGTPVVRRTKLTAWLRSPRPNTARTMDRCSSRYTPPVTRTKIVAMRIIS